MSTTDATIRSALSHPRFRRLLTALAISQAGDWLYNLALLALVLERTHSTMWVALTTAARVAPIVLMGPLGGVLADRWDRRRTMIASDLIRLGAMLGLAAVAATGLPIVLAPVLAGIATAAASPYPPCVAATTPRLVPDDVLPGANAARSAVGMLCMVAGPGFGALLLLLGSTTAAFLINGVTFALSAVVVASLPAGDIFTPGHSEDQPAGIWAELRTGAAALRARPQAVRLIGADVMCSVVYGAHTVLLLLLARQLGLGDAGYGYLLAALGVGGVLGTLVAGRVASATRQGPLLMAAVVTVSLPAMLLAITSWVPVALLWALLIGAGSVVVEVASDTSLQRRLAPEVLARAAGIALPAAFAGIVLGSLVAAPLVTMFGLSGALVTIGAAMAGYLVVLARGERRADDARPLDTAETVAVPAA
jgi:MFS family permease